MQIPFLFASRTWVPHSACTDKWGVVTIWICWHPPWTCGPRNLCEKGLICCTWLSWHMPVHSNLVTNPIFQNCSISEGTAHQYFGGENTRVREMTWYGQGATGDTVSWFPSMVQNTDVWSPPQFSSLGLFPSDNTGQSVCGRLLKHYPAGLCLLGLQRSQWLLCAQGQPFRTNRGQFTPSCSTATGLKKKKCKQMCFQWGDNTLLLLGWRWERAVTLVYESPI